MKLDFLLQLPWAYYTGWALVIPVILTTIPPKPYRKYIAISVTFPILFYATFIYQNGANPQPLALLLQGMFSIFFLYTTELFIVTEYPEFHDYRIGFETPSLVRSYPSFSLQKFKWAIARSSYNIRGIGWNWELSGIIHLKDKKRLKWFWNLVVYKILIRYAIFDIMFNLYLSTAYIKGNAWDPDAIDLYSGSGLPLYKQSILAVCTMYCVYYGIDLLYNICAFIWIALGIYDPQDFPPLFGSFKNNFTVGSVWGNVWHKLMYKMTVPIARSVSEFVFKTNKRGRSTSSKMLTYFLTFCLTGAVHAMGTSFLPWNSGAGYNINIPSWCPPILYILGFKVYIGRWFWSFVLFPYQFFVIVLESACIEVWNKTGLSMPKRLKMLLGLIFIFFAEFIICQRYVDEIAKGGLKIQDLSLNTPIHRWFLHNDIYF
ncbi:hypothetical protein CANARDRAFT_28824 [[Candida] arabinofermentans NRRL YB-2248]|uniref:Wax synthase domain-containing protein n=1 Tax=[Candida] arabinofermentans NRRL YB-2248 TaxID=983967 RepID=A0A1E4SYS7_9ASCO|nr:hypothetical protein CANARDRAFT_28824 [[Candida] arabinofermentans NRRL YB-2248]